MTPLQQSRASGGNCFQRRRVVAGSSIDAITKRRAIDYPVIAGGGHFLQEDAGEELAKHIVDFLR